MNSQCINSKVDFRENDVTTDEEAHFITTKGSIYQEDLKLSSVYASNKRVFKIY